MKLRAGERSVGGRQRAAKAGKGDIIAFIPSVECEARHQPLRLRPKIGGKPAPAVMPAKAAPRLDQRKSAPRRMVVQRERDQPARQPAADDDDIMRPASVDLRGLR